MKEFFRKFVSNKLAAIGGIIIVIFMTLAAIAGIIAPYDPALQALDHVTEPPSKSHIFGTDEFGRDIFSRIVWGARTSLFIGISVVVIGGISGVFLGVVSGYFGGWLDMAIMRITDTLMAFPTILLALIFITILGGNMQSTILSVALASIPRFVRLSRASTLSIREREYIEAAIVIGQTDEIILFRHILPNCIAPILVLATLNIGNSIMTVSGLGFLGLGVNPETAEWGAMLSNARLYLRNTPHVAIFPGLAIAFAVLGFNLLGDGLRDVLDVRQD
jgi:peptide/nickel transport system permease protein